MNIIALWVVAHGRSGRERIFHALREEYPTITRQALSNYIRGTRRPDKAKAKIIAKIMDVPLKAIPYRYDHSPKMLRK